jgi:hypothetical protein
MTRRRPVIFIGIHPFKLKNLGSVVTRLCRLDLIISITRGETR